jgi:hypothetical protein
VSERVDGVQVSLPQPLHTPTADGNYRLVEDFTLGGLPIRAGFVWDLASIPWWLVTILWPLGLRRDGVHRAAALVHDYLYRARGLMPQGGRLTRKEVDRLFAGTLVVYGLARWRVCAMYLAVRLGGWAVW